MERIAPWPYTWRSQCFHPLFLPLPRSGHKAPAEGSAEGAPVYCLQYRGSLFVFHKVWWITWVIDAMDIWMWLRWDALGRAIPEGGLTFTRQVKLDLWMQQFCPQCSGFEPIWLWYTPRENLPKMIFFIWVCEIKIIQFLSLCAFSSKPHGYEVFLCLLTHLKISFGSVQFHIDFSLRHGNISFCFQAEIPGVVIVVLAWSAHLGVFFSNSKPIINNKN